MGSSGDESFFFSSYFALGKRGSVRSVLHFLHKLRSVRTVCQG